MHIDMNHYREYANIYTNNAPPYKDGLIFIQSGVEKKDIDCLLMWLRRLCKAKKGLSFLLASSSHESKGTIKRKTIRTGKPGRPKTVVQGKKAEAHIHGLIVNESTDTDIQDVKKDLQVYCKNRRKKRPNLKTQKITEAWQGNLSIVKYMMRQSDSVHSYGDFDFEYFKSPYYMPPKPDNYDNILDFEN